MRFEPKTTGASWSETRPARPGTVAELLPLLDGRKPTGIVEIGPGTGERALALLRKFPSADYIGFEPSPALLAVARAAVATFAERAAVEPRDLAIQLPLSTGAADLALCLDILEYLRMDELYMTIAEARRALRPGSLCVLRCLSFRRGLLGQLAARLRTWFPRHFRGARALELNYYVSPEDWRVLSDTRTPDGWLTRQTLVLERLPEPAATG